MTRTPKTSDASKEDCSARPSPAHQLPSSVRDGGLVAKTSVPAHREHQSYAGLGAVQLHIEELRPIHDASAMAELRARLDELKIASVWTFERAEIIALLKIVADVLDNSMEKSAYVQHGAAGLLSRFIEALD